MLNLDSQKKLPLPTRSLAILFTGLVLALLAVFMPAERADAGIGDGYVFPLPSEHQYGDGFGAGRGHDGQDLFAKCGRKLVAANDGKIQVSEKDGSGYGNMIVLDVKGNDVDLLYAHMKRRDVKVGDRVNAGEKVGEVGHTGNATGCHLHFEIYSAPGYGEGGRPMRKVTKFLKEWDAYS